MIILSLFPSFGKSPDPAMITTLPIPKFACAYCGHFYPLNSLQAYLGGDACPDCRTFLGCGIDPRPWCELCGRSLPGNQTCSCQEETAYCGSCKSELPYEDLFISPLKIGLLCEICWGMEALRGLIIATCRMLEGLMDLMEVIERERGRS